MLQRLFSRYTTPISKFKSNPSATLAESRGEAVAVSSHNQIQFYAVPAKLYEAMVNIIELKQNQITEYPNTSPNNHYTAEVIETMMKNYQDKLDEKKES